VVEGTFTKPTGAGLLVVLHPKHNPVVFVQEVQSGAHEVHEVAVDGLGRYEFVLEQTA